MTLRKYKKLLMGYGVERDLAELETRRKGAVRRLMMASDLVEDVLDPERCARVLMETWDGKLKNLKKEMVKV